MVKHACFFICWIHGFEFIPCYNFAFYCWFDGSANFFLGCVQTIFISWIFFFSSCILPLPNCLSLFLQISFTSLSFCLAVCFSFSVWKPFQFFFHRFSLFVYLFSSSFHSVTHKCSKDWSKKRGHWIYHKFKKMHAVLYLCCGFFKPHSVFSEQPLNSL